MRPFEWLFPVATGLATLMPATMVRAEREAGGRLATLAVLVQFSAAAPDEAAQAEILRLSGDAVARGKVTVFRNRLLAADAEPSVCAALDSVVERRAFELALQRLLQESYGSQTFTLTTVATCD